MNLQQTSPEPYYTCPYCLTQIKIDQTPKADKKPEETPLEKAQPKINLVVKENSVKNNDKPNACQHHPGYLSERTSKEQIPDECLVCKDIVSCMLKKMRE